MACRCFVQAQSTSIFTGSGASPLQTFLRALIHHSWSKKVGYHVVIWRSFTGGGPTFRTTLHQTHSCDNLKQNETQSACLESTNKGVN